MRLPDNRNAGYNAMMRRQGLGSAGLKSPEFAHVPERRII
jgi:hypothetical protein